MVCNAVNSNKDDIIYMSAANNDMYSILVWASTFGNVSGIMDAFRCIKIIRLVMLVRLHLEYVRWTGHPASKLVLALVTSI